MHPWSCNLPPFNHLQHEKSFSTTAAYHRIQYAESGHRSKKHRLLRSTFFLSWNDWELSKSRVVAIVPIGKYYTLTSSALSLIDLLKSGKPINHEHASKLRLNTIGELIEDGISIPMAEKYAELDLLIRIRSGTSETRNSRGTALALLALFRVQQERLNGMLDWPINNKSYTHANRDAMYLLNVMRVQIEVFSNVMLSTFHLHCTKDEDKLRALEIYELFARVGMGLGHFKLSATFWEKKYAMCNVYYGIHHIETSRSLGLLGQIYAAGGLHADAEACLRQSLRKKFVNRLPGVKGLRGRNKDSKKTKIDRQARQDPQTCSMDQKRNVKVLSSCYLHLDQYDHAETMLQVSLDVCQDVNQQNKSKQSLANIYQKIGGER